MQLPFCHCSWAQEPACLLWSVFAYDMCVCHTESSAHAREFRLILKRLQQNHNYVWWLCVCVSYLRRTYFRLNQAEDLNMHFYSFEWIFEAFIKSLILKELTSSTISFFLLQLLIRDKKTTYATYTYNHTHITRRQELFCAQNERESDRERMGKM